MADKLDQALTKRWAEYRRLLANGATYSAAVRLAEMNNCLRNVSSHEPAIQKWNQIVAETQLADDKLAAVRDEAQKRIDRLAKMLSVGLQFSYEELLLAVTDRTELDLLLSFLHERKIYVDFDARVLDDDLAEIASSQQNSGAFRSAQTAAKRNWGLPIRSRWLDGVPVSRRDDSYRI